MIYGKELMDKKEEPQTIQLYERRHYVALQSL